MSQYAPNVRSMMMILMVMTVTEKRKVISAYLDREFMQQKVLNRNTPSKLSLILTQLPVCLNSLAKAYLWRSLTNLVGIQALWVFCFWLATNATVIVLDSAISVYNGSRSRQGLYQLNSSASLRDLLEGIPVFEIADPYTKAHQSIRILL